MAGRSPSGPAVAVVLGNGQLEHAHQTTENSQNFTDRDRQCDRMPARSTNRSALLPKPPTGSSLRPNRQDWCRYRRDSASDRDMGDLPVEHGDDAVRRHLMLPLRKSFGTASAKKLLRQMLQQPARREIDIGSVVPRPG